MSNQCTLIKTKDLEELREKAAANKPSTIRIIFNDYTNYHGEKITTIIDPIGEVNIVEYNVNLDEPISRQLRNIITIIKNKLHIKNKILLKVVEKEIKQDFATDLYHMGYWKRMRVIKKYAR